ncbi:MAG TPA: DUF350 domain-containing protein [Gemmatimonadales bacterium]|jgi:hypothetical protein
MSRPRLFDSLTPQVDLKTELHRGNVAVAMLGSLFIAIAIIIGGALN